MLPKQPYLTALLSRLCISLFLTAFTTCETCGTIINFFKMHNDFWRHFSSHSFLLEGDTGLIVNIFKLQDLDEPIHSLVCLFFYMLFVFIESLRLEKPSKIPEPNRCPTFCFTDITLFCSVLFCSYSHTRFFWCCFVFLKNPWGWSSCKAELELFFYSF